MYKMFYDEEEKRIDEKMFNNLSASYLDYYDQRQKCWDMGFLETWFIMRPSYA